MSNSKKLPRDLSRLPFNKPIIAEGNNLKVTEGSSLNATSTRRLIGALVVPIEMVVPNKQQVRQIFNQETLQELSEDIKVRGILEPLIVRETAPGEYEIIAGERRFKAALLAGLTELPVIVQSMDDEQARFATLVENIQREDLNPADEKRFFLQLQAQYNLSTSEIGKLINKSQSYVSKRLNPDTNNVDGKSEMSIKTEIDSENNNKLFQNNRLRNISQTTDGDDLREMGKHEQSAKSSPSLKWRTSSFKPAYRALENTLMMLTSLETQPDPKIKALIEQEVSEMETKLAEIKSFLNQQS